MSSMDRTSSGTAETGDARIVEPRYDTSLEQRFVVARMFKAEAHSRHGRWLTSAPRPRHLLWPRPSRLPP